MLVQRVLTPASSLESWTVLGSDGAVVEPVERYLAYLSDIERSPNTVKAYAHDLKDWLVFLDQPILEVMGVRLDRVRGPLNVTEVGKVTLNWLHRAAAGSEYRPRLNRRAGHQDLLNQHRTSAESA